MRFVFVAARKRCVGEVWERGRFSSSSILQKRKLRPRDIFLCLAKLLNDGTELNQVSDLEARTLSTLP